MKLRVLSDLVNFGKRIIKNPLKSAIITIGLTGILCGGCSYHYLDINANKISQPKNKEKWMDSIVYEDFYDIDFDALPTHKIEMPKPFKSLNKRIKLPKVTNQKKLEKIVFENAEKLSYDKTKIANLSIKDALNLCLNIVSETFEYFDVDNDEEFIKKYGEFLPIEEYMEIGNGDCNKYSDAFIATFRIIKKQNKNLNNVYVTYGDLGGMTKPHAWNSLLYFTENQIIITHIDPTRYDNHGSLEAKKGYHIPWDYLEFRARFFSKLKLYDKSYEYYEKLYSQPLYIIRRAQTLSKMAFVSSQLDDKQKMDKVRKRFSHLFTKEMTKEELDNLSSYHDNILYYSYKIEESKKNYKKAEQYKKELIELFPKSYWTRQFMKK